MRVQLLAIGRLKAGPERELCQRYAERFEQLGRALSFTLVQREFEESQARRPDDRKLDESRRIEAAMAEGGPIVCLDERGEAFSSQQFSTRLAGWRDNGQRMVSFVIGGADGLDEGLRQRAELVLGFGRLTLPHQIVRVLVLEQLYRAASMIGGHPYHRT